MILWLGVGAGLMAGLGVSRWQGQSYRYPTLDHIGLVFIGFLPQLVIIYLGSNRITVPDWLAALSIVVSQFLLLVFAWLNRSNAGMPVLIAGLILNLAVIVANGGFMPIDPDTAGQVVGAERVSSIDLGSRIGYKDVLLPAEDTHFEWLADRYTLPAWVPYQAAFSLGDVLIAIGAFGLLAYQKSRI